MEVLSTGLTLGGHASTPHISGGQLDELLEAHFRRQLMQEPSQPYGSNTTHCLRACSQPFLLATQGISAGEFTSPLIK